MPLNVNINLVVPDVPENDVWWANAAAWKNYWRHIDLVATFDGAATDPYNEFAYDNTLQNVQIVYDDVPTDVPTLAQHNSLVNAYNALNADYKLLKQTLVDLGIISQV